MLDATVVPDRRLPDVLPETALMRGLMPVMLLEAGLVLASRRHRDRKRRG